MAQHTPPHAGATNLGGVGDEGEGTVAGHHGPNVGEGEDGEEPVRGEGVADASEPAHWVDKGGCFFG